MGYLGKMVTFGNCSYALKNWTCDSASSRRELALWIVMPLSQNDLWKVYAARKSLSD